VVHGHDSKFGADATVRSSEVRAELVRLDGEVRELFFVKIDAQKALHDWVHDLLRYAGGVLARHEHDLEDCFFHIAFLHSETLVDNFLAKNGKRCEGGVTQGRRECQAIVLWVPAAADRIGSK
jgi:hypothetical protein